MWNKLSSGRCELTAIFEVTTDWKFYEEWSLYAKLSWKSEDMKIKCNLLLTITLSNWITFLVLSRQMAPQNSTLINDPQMGGSSPELTSAKYSPILAPRQARSDQSHRSNTSASSTSSRQSIYTDFSDSQNEEVSWYIVYKKTLSNTWVWHGPMQN